MDNKKGNSYMGDVFLLIFFCVLAGLIMLFVAFQLFEITPELYLKVLIVAVVVTSLIATIWATVGVIKHIVKNKNEIY